MGQRLSAAGYRECDLEDLKGHKCFYHIDGSCSQNLLSVIDIVTELIGVPQCRVANRTPDWLISLPSLPYFSLSLSLRHIHFKPLCKYCAMPVHVRS